MRMVDICIEEMQSMIYKKYDYTIDDVFEEACKIFKLDKHIVVSRHKGREYVFCRFIIAYVSRVCLGYKLADISRVLGFDDHTAACYSIKKVNQWLDTKDALFMRYWGKYIAESKIWGLYNEK